MHRTTAEIASSPPDDFRWVLRRETEAEHQQLDDLVTRLDLGQVDDLARFFRMHLACFDGMAVHSADHRLRDMITALRSDLVALGCADRPAPVALAPVHPLAVDYILAGSRMGTKVLRKRWARSDNPLVQAACNYFSLDSTPGEWADTCARLNTVQTTSVAADQIVRDSRMIFERFVTSFHRASATVG